MQKIGLVLARVDSAQQPTAFHPRVVTGGEPVGAEAQRMLVTDPELDLAIAGDIGVRGAPRCEFVEKVPEHAVPVLGREA